jgi:hypothetical protein
MPTPFITLVHVEILLSVDTVKVETDFVGLKEAIAEPKDSIEPPSRPPA